MNVKTFLVIAVIVIQIKGDFINAKNKYERQLKVVERPRRTTPKYMTRHSRPSKSSTHGRPTPASIPPKLLKVPKIKLESNEPCEYRMYYCNRAYKTSKLCCRTLYYQYITFENICEMEFVNCRHRFDMWHIDHMGPCFDFVIPKDFNHYEYLDDFFLDQTYIIQP